MRSGRAARTVPTASAAAVALAVCLGAASGCTRAVPIGANRAPCGDAVCAAGEYCCNASCGICAPAGAGCIEIACGGPCDPQDVAAADPMCPSMRVLGFAWNGATCTLLPGCACVGADCGAVYPTLEACLSDRAGCMMPPRPCIAASDCGPGELCDFPDDRTCGSTGTTGLCRPREPTCTGVLDPVCGCDGSTYGNACVAQSLGVDVAFYGPCDPCAPEDAAPAAGGTCMSILGQVWNGAACVDVIGCACSGLDCPLIERGDCEMRHAGCSDPMRFDCVGLGTCARWAEVCVVEAPPDGAHCEPIAPGCEPDPCGCIMAGMCTNDLAGAVIAYR